MPQIIKKIAEINKVYATDSNFCNANIFAT